MAFYRIVCMKRPDIAMSLRRQKQIMNQFFLLEFMVMMYFLVLHIIGTKMSGSSPQMAFCRGHSMAMDRIIKETDGTTPWTISVGYKFSTTVVFYFQVSLTFFLGFHFISFQWTPPRFRKEESIPKVWILLTS